MNKIFALLVFTLCVTASAQTSVQEWQAEAMKKYPALGVQGSAFNKVFLAEYERRKQIEPDFERDMDWPMRIADAIAASQKAASARAVPTPSAVADAPAHLPQTDPKADAKPLSPPAFGDTLDTAQPSIDELRNAVRVPEPWKNAPAVDDKKPWSPPEAKASPPATLTDADFADSPQAAPGFDAASAQPESKYDEALAATQQARKAEAAKRAAAAEQAEVWAGLGWAGLGWLSSLLRFSV